MMTMGGYESFENRLFPREIRMAMQVGHSFKMIVWAVTHIESIEPLISTVSIEIFLIHFRLLCEFLHIRPSGGTRDFSFQNLVVGSNSSWIGPSPEDISLLAPIWETASSLVVHFSLQRTPDTLEEIETFDRSEAQLRLLTERIFQIVDSLIAHYGVILYRGIDHLSREILFAREILNGGEPSVGPWIPPLT